MKVKDVLISELSKIKDDKVGILLSGGNGSASVFYTLLELGKKVHAYTFHMENHESTDLKIARALCEKYNVKHTAVPLPSSLNDIKRNAYELVKNAGCKLKTDVECCFAVKNTLPFVEEKILTTGMGDDNYFALTKNAQIYYTQTAELMDQYREKAHNKYVVQLGFMQKMANEYNVEIVAPYQAENMRKVFKGTTNEQINKPKMKQWILDTYPEKFEENKYYHADFQKGDSKISDAFLVLLDSDWNLRDYKRTDGIYNSIGRGELPLKNEVV